MHARVEQHAAHLQISLGYFCTLQMLLDKRKVVMQPGDPMKCAGEKSVSQATGT